MGDVVLFDSDRSYIGPGTMPELDRLRDLVQKRATKVQLCQDSGVLVLTAVCRLKTAGSFHGQGQ